MSRTDPPSIATFGAGSLVGVPVRRIEDGALLRGAGSFVDDLDFDGCVHLTFVRSTFAHARLERVDLTRARQMPGVIGAFSAHDLDLPAFTTYFAPSPLTARPPLATSKVRFVGDMVAVVAAETKAQADDAAEHVVVDYDPQPVVVDMEQALTPGAPLLFEDFGTNLGMGQREPDGFDPLAGADVVVRGRFENQRLAVVPMEGAAIAVVPGPDDLGHDLTVYLGCQFPHSTRERSLTKQFDLAPEKVRVIAPDVGGSFGAKHWAPEHIVAVRVALELNRPVKWVETRSENMVATPHGRGQVQYVELGLTRDGTFVGMRCRVVGDTGGYPGMGGIMAGGSTRSMASGVYRIPKIGYDVAVAFTNTTPMGAYRGAGRPEAASLVERIVDMAADELGIDPVELRRRNFVQSEEFPYTTATRAVYDSGDYDAAFTKALDLADYEGLRAEQRSRRERGDRIQMGIGVACYVEVTAGGIPSDFAEIEVHDDGTATLKSGTSAHGQGHGTAFVGIASGMLGIPVERFKFVQSDTALVPRGGGTGGSRSLQIGGSAVLETSQLVLDQARRLAAELFEAAEDDIVVDDGRFGVAGVPAKSLGWSELAAAAQERDEPLVVAHDFHQSAPSYPFGAHIAVVDVDTETGKVTLVKHVAVDDCGRIINPLLVDGQVHGGLAAGVSQALWEQMVYDEDGNPITSTLADYALPSAAEFPSFEVAHTETLSPNNPLGAKGIGESATVGSTPAVQNAVVDALSHLGIRHLDMPFTPERVWRAIVDAQAGRPELGWREPPAFFASLPVRPGAEKVVEIDL